VALKVGHCCELTNLQYIIDRASSSEILIIEIVTIFYTQLSNSVKMSPSREVDGFSNQSKGQRHFMEPEVLVPRPHEATAFPCPETA
jgi:hypothetical protein